MKDNYSVVLEESRREFAQKNTMEMARASGAAFSIYPPLSWREFLIPYLGRAYQVIWPTGEVLLYPTKTEASTSTALILIHYLIKASGKPAAGNWLPFSQLWGGNSYNTAFKKRALDPLADYFGGKEALFNDILLNRLRARQGKEQRAFLIMALPRLPLMIRLDPGDKEVPSRAAILFDAVANEYLATEDLAAVGENLAARLLHWGREQEKHGLL
ncbi:MAG: DUF3786 domain-containing protein [Bacillota bacterium]